MTRASTTLFAGLGLALSLAATAIAQNAPTFMAGKLKIEQPWSRATPRGAPVAGGYLKITNTGEASDRLLSGETTIAARFSVHEMAMEAGVMKMRPLAGGLEIKPGATFTYTFTADYAGVWMYHCGTAPALLHIANGMFGMVIVEPKGGLPKVDRE